MAAHLDVRFLADLCYAVLRDTPFPQETMEGAISLLLGTAATESGLRRVRQTGDGPARGLFQIEPWTARDLHAWLLAHAPFRAILEARVGVTRFHVGLLDDGDVYPILLARTLYFVRDPEPMPEPEDSVEQAGRYKRYYNTSTGAGSIEKYIRDYQALIAPVWSPRREA
jgi:hypothetical protein